jgi:hypothetical protein
MSFLSLCVKRLASAAHFIGRTLEGAGLLLTNMLPAFLPTAPFQSLPSHSKVASFTFRMFPHIAGLLAVSNGQKPTRYVVWLEPWRLAHYDWATESLLLRQ